MHIPIDSLDSASERELHGRLSAQSTQLQDIVAPQD